MTLVCFIIQMPLAGFLIQLSSVLHDFIALYHVDRHVISFCGSFITESTVDSATPSPVSSLDLAWHHRNLGLGETCASEHRPRLASKRDFIGIENITPSDTTNF